VELNQSTTVISPNGGTHSRALSGFRYYIHDHSHVFRLELIGKLGKSDIPELDGSWNTASRAVAERKICIDVRKLTGTEDAARQWLSKMALRPGVEFLASPHLVSELPEGCDVQIASPPPFAPGGRYGFLRALFRARRKPVSYQPAGAEVRAPLAISTETQMPAA
jgi:hypothetical protein